MVRLIDAERGRRESLVELATAQAWQTAAMTRVKRLLPLKRYVPGRGPGDVPEPTEAERSVVEAAAARWVDLLGGGAAGGGS